MNYRHSWWQAFIHLIFPTLHCLNCGKTEAVGKGGLCASCRQKFQEAKEFSRCKLCPIFVVPGKEYCYNCWSGKTHWFDAGLAPLPYTGEMRKAMQSFKYRGRTKWAQPFAELMEEALVLDSRFSALDLIVPVPLHVNRRRERGYNQSELLAKKLGQGLALPVAIDVLLRIRDTPSQTGLKKQGRQKNLAGAFQVTNPHLIKSKNILLVDDIYTTGTTVETCACILKKGGAKKVLVVTCAAGKSY